MLATKLGENFSAAKGYLQDRIKPPHIKDVVDHERRFMEAREAIYASRSVVEDINNLELEVEEVQAEIWPSGTIPSHRQRMRMSREIADVIAYGAAATVSYGIPSKRVEEVLLERHQQEGAPAYDRATNPQPYIESLAAVTLAASKLIKDGPHPLDCPHCYPARVEEAILNVIDTAWQIGKKIDPHFEVRVNGKLRKNERRFDPERFRLQPDETDAEAALRRRHIGYAQAKVLDRGEWKPDKAHAYLRQRGITDVQIA